MAFQRWLIGKAGFVANVVGSDVTPNLLPDEYAMVDPTGSTAVGAVFDQKDSQYTVVSPLDQAILTCLFQIAKGTVPGGIGNAALTAAQFKNYIKGLMT